MDTWATSSLTPQIAGGWDHRRGPVGAGLPDGPVHPGARHHPHLALLAGGPRRTTRTASRPGRTRWSPASSSTPTARRCRKSKGNAVVPTEILDKYGADAVRWRAAMARPGLDSPFDETQMKVGRRLAMKVLNASKFVLGSVGATSPDPVAISEPVDCALMGRLAGVIDRRDRGVRGLRLHHRARGDRAFFWEFCDDYLELVKERAYAEDGGSPTASARATLALALHVQLRLLAPFLPYVTEEVWSWWQDGLGAPQPLADGDRARLLGGDRRHHDRPRVAAALTGIRGAKSQAKASMRAELSRVELTGTPAMLAAVRAGRGRPAQGRQDHRRPGPDRGRGRDGAPGGLRPGGDRLRSTRTAARPTGQWRLPWPLPGALLALIFPRPAFPARPVVRCLPVCRCHVDQTEMPARAPARVRSASGPDRRHAFGGEVERAGALGSPASTPCGLDFSSWSCRPGRSRARSVVLGRRPWSWSSSVGLSVASPGP